jgi:hypothetical protein
MRKRAIHNQAASVFDMDRPTTIRPLPWLHLIGPVVYAIRTKDGLIKIGWTSDLYNRVRGFGGTGSILAWMPGTLDDEQALHRGLATHVARGREYYNPTAEVLSEVNAMRETLGLDPIAA